MLARLILPLLFLCFAGISLTILQSINPTIFPIHTAYYSAAALVFLLGSSIPYALWKKIAVGLYILTIVLLILTLVINDTRKGAARWLDLGPITIQPSQIAQPITLLVLSIYSANYQLKSFKSITFFGLILMIPWVLIFIEPNLGTSLVLLFSAGAIFYSSEIKMKWILSALCLFLLAAVIGWIFLLKPYQKQRVISFLYSDLDRDSSYNARQSVVAVGSGGIWGRGLGHGVQSQLRFLPERHTDFIFASLAEEVGLVGSSFVLFLYGVLFTYLLYLAVQTQDQSQRYFCLSVTAFFTIQIFINIGMNMGIFPITGITLPYISYGGSSLLSLTLLLCILQRIAIETLKPKAFEIK